MATLKDKTIIITGSSMGIGKTMARMMGQQGARIVLNARNKTRLEKCRKELADEGLKVTAIAGDVSYVEDCDRLVKHAIDTYGQLDVLINNAGISMEGTVEELDPTVFKKVMDVNFLGSVYPTKSALPQLRKTGGSVIFIGSAAGIRGLPKFASYSASKMALTALAESLKIELTGSGVHVGLAYVGFTENDPEKTIYDKDGKLIPQPNRSKIKAEPPQKVAERIIRMINNRTFKQVFTPLGRLNAVVNRFAPSLGEMILRKNYLKDNK